MIDTLGQDGRKFCHTRHHPAATVPRTGGLTRAGSEQEALSPRTHPIRFITLQGGAIMAQQEYVFLELGDIKGKATTDGFKNQIVLQNMS